jgi:Mor family transcriptional regulator
MTAPDIDARDPAQIDACWADPRLKVRWPAQFLALVALLDGALATAPAGLSRERLSLYLTVKIYAGLHGERRYFPHPDQVRRLLREAAIWRDFDGHNVDELARRYRLSRAQVYRALQRQRAWRQASAARDG